MGQQLANIFAPPLPNQPIDPQTGQLMQGAPAPSAIDRALPLLGALGGMGQSPLGVFSGYAQGRLAQHQLANQLYGGFHDTMAKQQLAQQAADAQRRHIEALVTQYPDMARELRTVGGLTQAGVKPSGFEYVTPKVARPSMVGLDTARQQEAEAAAELKKAQAAQERALTAAGYVPGTGAGNINQKGMAALGSWITSRYNAMKDSLRGAPVTWESYLEDSRDAIVAYGMRLGLSEGDSLAVAGLLPPPPSEQQEPPSPPAQEDLPEWMPLEEAQAMDVAPQLTPPAQARPTPAPPPMTPYPPRTPTPTATPPPLSSGQWRRGADGRIYVRPRVPKSGKNKKKQLRTEDGNTFIVN